MYALYWSSEKVKATGTSNEDDLSCMLLQFLLAGALCSTIWMENQHTYCVYQPRW